ncbi:hypothetical protein [Microvirga pudoricolor]|uniref:hypothetical protein n=1 Tax=Microvirga pudoricolor TaxID=2778729 RepID=UPI00194F70E7|nr:hypothetical protein [Microvirga pudoricolor]MBM6594481.1 hypothetical protein [Microvirga pudoricolor]
MRLSQWILGAVTAGLCFGAAQAAPMPVGVAPAPVVAGIETVQYYYGPPPRRYYGPPRHRYRNYGPPPRYYGRRYGPPRAYYGPPRGYRQAAPVRRAYGPPRAYSRDQVRAWNRAHGF